MKTEDLCFRVIAALDRPPGSKNASSAAGPAATKSGGAGGGVKKGPGAGGKGGGGTKGAKGDTTGRRACSSGSSIRKGRRCQFRYGQGAKPVIEYSSNSSWES